MSSNGSADFSNQKHLLKGLTQCRRGAINASMENRATPCWNNEHHIPVKTTCSLPCPGQMAKKSWCTSCMCQLCSFHYSCNAMQLLYTPTQVASEAISAYACTWLPHTIQQQSIADDGGPMPQVEEFKIICASPLQQTPQQLQKQPVDQPPKPTRQVACRHT